MMPLLYVLCEKEMLWDISSMVDFDVLAKCSV